MEWKPGENIMLDGESPSPGHNATAIEGRHANKSSKYFCENLCADLFPSIFRILHNVNPQSKEATTGCHKTRYAGDAQ